MTELDVHYSFEQVSKVQEFETALDNLKPKIADVIVVLTCRDAGEDEERYKVARSLLAKGQGKILIMFNADHTQDEARKTATLLEDVEELDTILLVTHRYHSYRAFLTFHKKLPSRKIYIHRISSGIVLGERDKIAKYAKLGDCSTYEEGLEYIKCL